MKGLHNKYIIKRADGKPIDDDAEFFILRYDKNAKNRIASGNALEAYAQTIKSENRELFVDLMGIVHDIKENEI